jgi:hypothetical protein
MSTTQIDFFQPLDRTTPTIRLIKIASVNIGPIECIFDTFNLDECPPYTALSYTWGSASPSASIWINGSRFRVGINLYTGLRAYRFKVYSGIIKPGFLWIDALCINQNDIRERNHQVNLMSRIYSEAELVLIWLRPESNDHGTAIDWIKRINDTTFERKLRHDPNYDEMDDIGLCGFEVAVSKLLYHPYWTRLWILQEIVLAKHILVLYGSDLCTWEELATCENRALLSILDFADAPARGAIKRRRIWKDLRHGERPLDYIINL